MNKLMSLIEKRNAAWNAAKSFVETNQDADGLLSKEDAKTYESLEAKVKDYSAEIERLQKMEALENELNRPMSAPLTTKPETYSAKPQNIRESKDYKDALLAAFRSNFKNVSNVLQEGTAADGGYLVPVEYDSRLIDVLTEENIMRKLATTITTAGEHRINVAGSKPAASWIDEGDALTFGDAKFSQILLDAHKLHVAVKVTEELLNDNAFNLEGYLMDAFGKALANAEEDAFLNGSTTGKPTGIFAATGGGTAAVTTTSLKADDVIDLVYALKRPYRKNAAFILNDKLIAKIRKLKYADGKEYIWQPTFVEGEPDRILGYPVYTSAYAPEDKIAFGDFSYYNIGDRGSRSFSELRELFAGNGMVGFVAKERVDGKLVLPEAVQILTIGSGS
ncbi:phage major capsid protein [Allobaculum mucilyticum]|uniref:phage major capsid protein n=3 Tax=Allobaculum mucilyticum TaxID=2834459 RepID=UPI001F60F68C|nr:phage major capsid protein [Allobaculum mucilyticum]UNT96732.1 phage major capsid protein [Allobaculum mucilyticum]